MTVRAIVTIENEGGTELDRKEVEAETQGLHVSDLVAQCDGWSIGPGDVIRFLPAEES
jgi:hypothetical protein